MLRRWVVRILIVVLILGVILGFLFWRSTIPAQPTAFYAPPDPLPPGAPGTLIRHEPVTTAGPAGAVAYRVLYLSTANDGNPVAVSGLVIAPEGAATSPRPVIAWANGTLGVRAECGTSHTDKPFSQIPELARLIAEGYVVAATDYPGRGTPGIHPYLVGPVEAASVLDSVRAAQQLDVGAGDRIGVWGRSQGGHSALWTGHVAGDYAPELELVAVAASAPAVDLPGIMRSGMDTRVGSIVISEALYAWAAVYPEIDLDELIVPEQRAEFEAVATTCLTTPTAFLTLGDIPTAAQYLQADALNDAEVVAIIDQNVPSGAISVPILISHGTGDHLIPFEGSEAEAGRRCAAGEHVELMRYPGEEHDAADVSAVATIGWLDDVFAGRPTGSTCPG